MGKRPVQRTCVGCREIKERESLIRLVSSPEGLLVPDLKSRLPGRGAYLCCDPECIRRALRKGGIAHALRRSLKPSDRDDLEQKLRETLESRIQGLISILMKGKKIVRGRESIRKSLQKHEVHLLLQAADLKKPGSGPGMDHVPVRVLFSRDRLGAAVGQSPQPLLGVLDAGGARELLRLIDMRYRLEPGGGE